MYTCAFKQKFRLVMKKNLFVVGFLYLFIMIISAATAQTTELEQKSDNSKIHLKVCVDEDGKKTHFEKTYPNMDALKKDAELDSLGIDLHMDDADDDGTPCNKDTKHEEEINEEINIKVDENGEKHIEIHIKKKKSN